MNVSTSELNVCEVFAFLSLSATEGRRDDIPIFPSTEIASLFRCRVALNPPPRRDRVRRHFGDRASDAFLCTEQSGREHKVRLRPTM